MYVKPLRPTPDPELGGYLREHGRRVEPTPYWLRRVIDGDVEEATPPAPAPAESQGPAVAGPAVSSASKSRKGPQP